MPARHKIRMSLAMLMLKVREGGGEVRFWSVAGGVGFFYVDRAGHHIAGWEDNDRQGIHCVVCHGYRHPDGMVNEPHRRCPARSRHDEEDHDEPAGDGWYTDAATATGMYDR